MRRALGTTVTGLIIAAVVILMGWFVYAAVTGATLVVFRTGSMAPSMPQGAIAATLPTAATDLQVGDVVTVQRGDDQLPVTHRVVTVSVPAESASGDNARELVLKGDANETVDRQPYLVTEVRRVVFAVPYLGTILLIVQSPPGMGVLTVLAAGLATWAFWPRRRNDPDKPSEPSADSVAARVGATS